MKEQILDNLEAEGGQPELLETLSDVEILKQIWFSPRTVLTNIHVREYDSLSLKIMVLYGVFFGLETGLSYSMGSPVPIYLLIPLCIVGGPLAGWILYYITAFCFSWSGKLLNGNASTSQLFRVFAYSTLPVIVQFDTVLLMSNFRLFQEFLSSNAIALVINLVSFLQAFWSVAILTAGISVVQNFSIARSIINYLLLIVLLISIVGGTYILIKDFSGII